MEVAEQGEEQSEDSLHLLMCGEQDIFLVSLTDSQLVAIVNTPTPVDPVVPARSAEAEKALQPIPDFDWNQEVKDQDSALLEHCLEVQEEGQVDPSLPPSPSEYLCQEDSREEVEQRSHQSEPSDNVGLHLRLWLKTSGSEQTQTGVCWRAYTPGWVSA